MNANLKSPNLKAPNNTATNTGISSFINAPIKSIQNATMSVANSVKNALPTNMAESINDSINETVTNTPMPFVSIPVIITLGMLIILFIIVVMFRQKIALGFELLWFKIRKLLNLDKPSPQGPLPEFALNNSSSETTSSKPNKPSNPSNPSNPRKSFSKSIEEATVSKIIPSKKEVFNVAQDKYTYTDAEPLCKAYGAELATYDQVKDAWQKGADWCNYGWVKGQAAVYPTQQSTYNKLQAGPESQRSACGIVGVNGGYFDNPEMRFGVNCYGVKPGENEADTRHIMANNGNLTPGALEYDRKVQNYKTKLNTIAVNPFQPGTWSS